MSDANVAVKLAATATLIVVGVAKADGLARVAKAKADSAAALSFIEDITVSLLSNFKMRRFDLWE
jgi:hypothetical protein